MSQDDYTLVRIEKVTLELLRTLAEKHYRTMAQEIKFMVDEAVAKELEK